MQIDSWVEEIPFKLPFSIAGRTLKGQSVLRIAVRYRQWTAHAEAAGVFYRGDSGEGMREEILQLLPRLSGELLADWGLVHAMRAGGARNALDWAFWQLAAAEQRRPVASLAHFAGVRALPTMVTLGLAPAEQMAQAAVVLPAAKLLKLKLEGTKEDAERVAAVRLERPDARLAVDANEGWSMAHLDWMMSTLVMHRVELVEQPLPAGLDDALAGFRSPIPLAADESLQTLADLALVAKRYQVANIKLDKCGGLSAALTLAAQARRQGLRVMVGCMGGRSMSILPAFIAAQGADLVDLDAPLFMATDSEPTARYLDGCIDFEPGALELAPHAGGHHVIDAL